LSTIPPPLPHQAPPPLPQRFGHRATLGTVVAWLVILASAGYIVATTVIGKNGPAGAGGVAQQVSFTIASRYAVGVHHTFSALQPAGKESQALALLPQVDEAAVTRDDKVKAAVIAGEVGGAAAALQRLDRIPVESEEGSDLTGLRALYAAGDASSLTPAQRQALADRHGWYGRLALTYGRAGDDAGRRDVLRPAKRTAWVLMAGTFAVIGGFLVGLVLLVVAVVHWAGGRFPTAYRTAATPTGPFLEAFAAYIAGMVGVSMLVQWLLGERPASSWFVVAILPFVFFWPLLRGVSWARLREGLGWHAGRGFWREVGAGFVGYLAGLPVLAAGALVTLLLQRFSGSDTSHPIVEQFGQGPWRTAQLFLLAAVWAPVVEETMFRGALYHHLRARLPWPAAAILIALLFAAIHPQGWAAIPALGGIALSLAMIREWRGSIIAPVVAHALNNGAVTLLMVLLLG
jgi:membrane protease YdiL (CAAX protease family)